MSEPVPDTRDAYQQAGVSIEAGDRAVEPDERSAAFSAHSGR